MEQTKKDIEDLVDGATKTIIAVSEVGMNAIEDKSLNKIINDFKETIASDNPKETIQRVIEHMPLTQSKGDLCSESAPPMIIEPSFSYVGNILVNDTIAFDAYYFNKITSVH